MRLVFCMFVLLFAACAMKPPAQEMSDARATIRVAQELPGDSPKAARYLKSAEQALDEAAKAIAVEKFDRARMKANQARRSAQDAARLKQKEM